MSTKQYFASLATAECITECQKRIKNSFSYLEKSGRRKKIQKATDYYYGRHSGESDNAPGSVGSAGDQGELATVNENYFRANTKHVLAMTIAQKPAFDPRAVNSDLDSIQQAKLANNILDAYLTEKRLGRHTASAAERGMVQSKGFVYMHWDTALGKAYSVAPAVDKDGQPLLDENGSPVEKIVYEGDVDACALSRPDVVYDMRVKDWGKLKYVMVRTLENRWDLIARYPAKKEELLNAPAIDALDNFDTLKLSKHLYAEGDCEDDMVPVWNLYHLRTDGLPNGRFLRFVDDVDLYDGPYPYGKKEKQRLPVFPMSPGDEFDSLEGYTDAFDMLCLQEVHNVLTSSAFTNQQAFGVQFLWLPEGCGISETNFKGLAVLKGSADGAEPKALQLTATPAEIFTNLERTKTSMRDLVGLNNAATGNPDSNLKSGAAIGRAQAMAIQYASNFQRSWAELNEDVGTFLLELIQQFANTERMVALAGKHNKGAMATFTGKDVSLIDRVVVDLGNPLARTVAGRIEMAETLFEKGAITAQEYIEVATTGQLESILESESSQLELIRKENEMLLEGKPVKAIVGDKHILHAQEHLTVINDPQIRTLAAAGDERAVAIIMATTQHIQEHGMLRMTQEPFFGEISGEPPPPMPPMPPQGPPPGGAAMPVPQDGPPEDPNQAPTPGPELPPAPPLPPEAA